MTEKKNRTDIHDRLINYAKAEIISPIGFDKIEKAANRKVSSKNKQKLLEVLKRSYEGYINQDYNLPVVELNQRYEEFYNSFNLLNKLLSNVQDADFKDIDKRIYSDLKNSFQDVDDLKEIRRVFQNFGSNIQKLEKEYLLLVEEQAHYNENLPFNILVENLVIIFEELGNTIQGKQSSRFKFIQTVLASLNKDMFCYVQPHSDDALKRRIDTIVKKRLKEKLR